MDIYLHLFDRAGHVKVCMEAHPLHTYKLYTNLFWGFGDVCVYQVMAANNCVLGIYFSG